MTQQPQHFVVWTEIPVRNLDDAIKYYQDVLGIECEINDMGPNKTAMFKVQDYATGISGHLYEGDPGSNGQGATVHMAVEGSLEDAMARVEPAGGKVVSPPIAMPFGRFTYTIDPDGNSIGLFEAA